MIQPLCVDRLYQLSWLEIDLVLRAHSPPRRAHPLAVLEALLKGVFESARLDPSTVKQLWWWPGVKVEAMGWETGSRIPITVQLFGLDTTSMQAWIEQLYARFTERGQNFDLLEVSPWRVAKPPSPTEEPSPALALDFLTPVPLPHRPGTPRTALDGEGFLRLCQSRLRKLFGTEGQLPPPPELDTTSWQYWRTAHRSSSQRGNPMFLHGCIGPLRLFGPELPAWKPWLALFAAVGLGERLSFSHGRLELRSAEAVVPGQNDPAPLQLRCPFVLDVHLHGCRLSLSNANLVVETSADEPIKLLPLLRISNIELHSACQVSTALLQACAELDIPVLLALPGRTPIHILGPSAEANRYRTLTAHHSAWQSLDEPDRVRLAARLISAKLSGYAHIVRQRYRPDDHKLLVRFKRACVGLVHARQLPAVRGWEGWASRHYWRWFAQQVNQLGGFEERRTHGQTQDPVNLALNYGYALLRHRLGVAVRLAGLDPYLGVLHEANGRHEALVSDLVEIFRPEVDRLVIRLIHLKMIQPKDFVFQDGLLWLRPEARRRFVQSFTRICEGLPRHGGSMLHSRIRRLVDSYRKAVHEGTLSDWRPIPQGWTKEAGGDFPP